MNPIIPKTNATFGSGAPTTLLLGEIATNRTAGELYLGSDTGVDLIAQKVTSIARGGTGSTSAAAALNALGAAPIVSPAFSGTPTVPTAAAGTSTLQAASTAFVQANKGDKYKTASTTTWNISKMVVSFTVDPGLSYTATQDITIAYDSANHAHGTVVSYVGTTLTVDVHNITGAGTYSNWTINIGGFSDAAGALLAINNLSDVASPATALSNLGGVSTAAIIPVNRGGTGSTTAQAALNQLVGGTTVNYIVGGDGSNVVLRQLTNNDLPLSGASAGTFGASNAVPVLTVNSRGVITALATAQIPAAMTFGTTPGAALTTAALAGISPNPARADHTHSIPITDLSGDVIGTGQGSVLTTLATTGVSAGAYGGSAAIPVLTIDAKGRVTAASMAALPAGLGLTTQPAAALETAALAGIASEAARADHAHAIPTTTLTGDVLGSGGGSVAAALATTGVSAGAYGSTAAIPVLTVDAKGRITAASTAAALTLTTATPAALGTAAVGVATTAARADHVHQTPTTTLTGDATGSGAGSVAVTLATSGVAANIYGSTAAIPVLTVDAKGRITSASTAVALRLGTTSPSSLGTSAAVGSSTLAAPLDHVHQIPFPAINSTAATAYTLTLSNNNNTVQFTAATAVTVTIPTNATAAFPIGSQILLLQYGAGQLTIGGAGVTLRSSGGKLKSATQYSLLTLLKIGTDEWVLGGDITT